ncbi:MAG: small basic protein [Planctomycetales bacterium]|nr:small basic protein [Planctomycetales bacterium]
MTIDKSLKVKAGSVRVRNVLTRVERIAKLTENGRFTEESTVLGMPKVRVQKLSLKKKKKEKKEDDDTKGKKKK